MNFKKLFFLMSLISFSLAAMDTTFLTPSVDFAKPRFARHNLTTIEMYGSYNQASSVYNAIGNTINTLSFACPELLLKRFVDATLPVSDTANFGYATITGMLKALKWNFGFIQNIHQNWFVSAHCNLISYQYQNLAIKPINAHGCPLTKTEINQISGLTEYIDDLEQTCFCQNSCKTFLANSTGPAYITIGYTNSFQNFKNLDFLDLTVQTGIWIPETINSQQNSIFQPVPNKLYNLGIPIQINATVGLYDWLNIGGCALLIPFISGKHTIPINAGNGACNSFLMDQKACCTVSSSPFFYGNFYFEAEQFIPHVTLLTGLSYIKQSSSAISCYQPKLTCSGSTGNLQSWEMVNLTINLELDLAKNSSRAMPRLRFTYVQPLWGKNAFKTRAYAGSFGIEIRYDF